MRTPVHLDVELEFERLIHQSRKLSIFRRNPSTWELLLKLASLEDAGVDGIYHTIEQIETRYLGSSALLKFVRDRHEDGLLEFREHAKRSKWRVTLESSLRDELLSLLAWRNNALLNGAAYALCNAAQPEARARSRASSEKSPNAQA